MKILDEIKICSRKGHPVLFQIIDDQPINYSKFRIDYAGNGHYFFKIDQVISYLERRKFASKKQTENLLLWISGKDGG